jgi:hypothetical protein
MGQGQACNRARFGGGHSIRPHNVFDATMVCGKILDGRVWVVREKGYQAPARDSGDWVGMAAEDRCGAV